MRFTSLGTWNVTVVESDTECTQSAHGVLGNVLNGIEIGTLLRKSGGDLVDQDCTCKTTVVSNLLSTVRVNSPSTNDGSLLSGNGNVISNEQHADISWPPGSSVLLSSKAKVKGISSVIHDNDQSSLLLGDQLDTSSNLGDIGRSEDVSADSSIQESGANEAGVRRLVARSTSGEKGDSIAVGFAVDD